MESLGAIIYVSASRKPNTTMQRTIPPSVVKQLILEWCLFRPQLGLLSTQASNQALQWELRMWPRRPGSLALHCIARAGVPGRLAEFLDPLFIQRGDTPELALRNMRSAASCPYASRRLDKAYRDKQCAYMLVYVCR